MIARPALALIAGLALAGCSAVDRLANIGEAPSLTPVAMTDSINDGEPVLMPMPPVEEIVYQPNSLWAPGARTFFKDQRAARVGDILTVEIEIEDKAQVENTTTRERTNAEDDDISSFLGVESSFANVLPEAVDPTNMVSLSSNSAQSGTGSVDRSEKIQLTVAAVVTQVLPNGNLVIEGRQEVRVNFEMRELLISGVVRPEDITNANTIRHTQIAEARISYGGRGQISDVQQPRYGQQLFDIVYPF